VDYIRQVIRVYLFSNIFRYNYIDVPYKDPLHILVGYKRS